MIAVDDVYIGKKVIYEGFDTSRHNQFATIVGIVEQKPKIVLIEFADKVQFRVSITWLKSGSTIDQYRELTRNFRIPKTWKIV